MRKRPPHPSLPVLGGELLAWWRAFPRFSTKSRLCFLQRPFCSPRFTCPTCHSPLTPHPPTPPHPPRAQKARERGKVWLEQLVALATLCATAADWNRNWPIHVSLQAGSGPCLVLTDYLISIQTARVSAPLLCCGKATPGSLFLKAPRALLSSPISCLNYAPFCAVVVFFFFLPSSSRASPSSSPPPALLSVSHFTVSRRSRSLKSDAGTVLASPPPPLAAWFSDSLPSSLHLKGNTVFSMHKRLGAVNRMNPPGPVENIPSVAATVSRRGGEVDG